LNAETHFDFMNISSSEDEQEVKHDDEASIMSPGISGRNQMNKTGGLTSKGPQVIDLVLDEKSYGFRPTTAVMAKQLNAIAEHNYALPQKKKAKESLPDIQAPNVYAKSIIKKDPKSKDPSKKAGEYFNKHFNVGIVDESKAHNPDAPINHAAGFKLEN